jgi:putative glutamine amidotransferase
MPAIALLVGRDPAHRVSVHRAYTDCVWEIGATPIILAPPPDERGLDRYVEASLRCAGVCATGGGDLAQGPTDGLMDPDPMRDAAERAAVVAARAASIPILGICRGIQLLALTYGGALHRDLPTDGYQGHWEEERQYEPVHDITADPGSLAAVALAATGRVNSIHHQAVRDPGPSLRPTAWSGDGLIEALEAPGVLGVQWHPERLATRDSRHLAPFRWLLSAA